MSNSRKFVVCLLVLSALIVCRRERPVPIVLGDASIACKAGTDYFPPEGTAGTGGLHFGAVQNEWEANHLSHMGEPSLYACGKAGADPEYRFLWDRRLSEPIVIRLVVYGEGGGALYAREIAHGGLLPPDLPGKKGKSITWDEWLTAKVDRQIHLNPAQVRQALGIFAKIEFPQQVLKAPGETTDGSDSIFESWISGRYRLVDFRNEPSAAARDCDLFLVNELGRMEILPRAVY